MPEHGEADLSRSFSGGRRMIRKTAVGDKGGGGPFVVGRAVNREW